jgi:DNA polymerase-3 subunit gamma/tau
MSYVVLARKWRPMSFEDLVGQEHVSRTLANAIQSGRVAHAFLFTGVRGVGKTTAARILAKALNCMGTDKTPRTGPTATPCLECAACREITAGTDVDVREIDGASYNGVDEVRKLQDSLPYRPARDRFKIFIVDEVHMLSQNAWNAFLKTLEEPPPHVKFIFATTEVQKVPVTILSRVQKFDFKLIPTQLIAKRLRHVLTTEKIPADDAALAILAREAAGSMRDAMSLLDQVIAWNDQKLDGDSVSRVLGVASRKVLHDLAAALVGGDASRCLGIVADLSNQGYDIATVARDLLALLRDLVISKVCKEPGELLDLADEERKDVLDLAGKSDADDLIRVHQGFSDGFDGVVRSSQPRAALEMLLVRLARRPPLIPIDDLIQRLGALEKRLGSPPAREPSAPGGGGGSGAQRAPSRPQPSSPAAGTGTHRRAEPESVRSEPARSEPVRSEPARSEPARSEPVRSEPARSSPVAAGGLVSEADLAVFRSVVDRLRGDRPELAALLHHASVLEVGRERITLAIESGSVVDRVRHNDEWVRALRDAAGGHFGSQTEVVFQQLNGRRDSTVAALDDKERAERLEASRSRARQHPRVAEAVQILGARIKEIRLPDDDERTGAPR